MQDLSVIIAGEHIDAASDPVRPVRSALIDAYIVKAWPRTTGGPKYCHGCIRCDARLRACYHEKDFSKNRTACSI